MKSAYSPIPRRNFFIGITVSLGIVFSVWLLLFVPEHTKATDVPNGLIKCDVVRVLEMEEKENVAVPDSYDNPIAVGGYYHWSRRMDCSFAPIDLSGNRGINIGVFNDMVMARDTLRVLTCYKATVLVLEVYYFKDSIQVSRDLGNGVHFK